MGDAIRVVIPRRRPGVNPTLDRRSEPVDVGRHALRRPLAVSQTTRLGHVLRHHRRSVRVRVVKAFPLGTTFSYHRQACCCDVRRAN